VRRSSSQPKTITASTNSRSATVTPWLRPQAKSVCSSAGLFTHSHSAPSTSTSADSRRRQRTLTRVHRPPLHPACSATALGRRLTARPGYRSPRGTARTQPAARTKTTAIASSARSGSAAKVSTSRDTAGSEATLPNTSTQHLGRVMHRQRLTPRRQRQRQLPVQPDRADRVQQHHRTRLRHRRPLARIDTNHSSGTHSRSAISGRFGTPAKAARHPNATVTERG